MLITFGSAFSQVKTISIISTNNITNTDIVYLKELETLLFGRKNKDQSQFNIEVRSVNDNTTIIIQKQSDFSLLLRDSPNKIFKSIEDLENYLNKMNGTNTFEFLTNTNFPNKVNFNSTSDLTGLSKEIKKAKTDKINIVWNNGFKPYIFSADYINSKLTDASISKLVYTPIITKPASDRKEVLRPDESHYYVEFDSVGLFPSYEVSIYWKKPISRDFNGFVIYDSVLFIQKCLLFTSENEFLSNKSKTNFALYPIDGSKCRIAIGAAFIANICYQNWKSNIDSSELPDDDDCSKCKFDCLYKKQFSIQIKGCATGLEVTKTHEGSTNIFQFQCSKVDLE
jgi:hypothetical protein